MAVLLAAMAAITVLAVVNGQGNGFSKVAERPDCTAVVKQVVRETQGRLLSLRIHGGQCIVSILVQRDNGRPRKMIIRADPRQKGAGKKQVRLDGEQPSRAYQVLFSGSNALSADRSGARSAGVPYPVSPSDGWRSAVSRRPPLGR